MSENFNVCSNIDSWENWRAAYADRDLRLMLYCRNPKSTTPLTTRSVIVRNIPIDTHPAVITDLFSQCGVIVGRQFPDVRCFDNIKFCILEYEYAFQAHKACQLLNGHWLEKGRGLDVALYDLSEDRFDFNSRNKRAHSKANGLSKNFPITAIAPDGNVVGYVKQAQLQHEDRASKLRVKNYCMTKFIEQKVEPEAMPSRSTYKFEQCKADLCETTKDLDSVVDFWEWLQGHLIISGPIDVNDSDIPKALGKLSPPAQQELGWILAVFRLAHQDSIYLIGPYVCLKEHAYYAKERCAVANIDFNVPYKDLWEPMHPASIKSEAELIKYVRAMLLNFGPLPVNDVKIRQFIALLNKYKQFDEGFNVGKLRHIVTLKSPVTVERESYYLTKEHDHWLRRLKSDNWLNQHAGLLNNDHNRRP